MNNFFSKSPESENLDTAIDLRIRIKQTNHIVILKLMCMILLSFHYLKGQSEKFYQFFP